jgi:threonyl-tRNA synthetase
MCPEKKEQLTDMRHSLAHVLAQSVQKLYPDVQIAIGPPIDTGCYYDFLFTKPITDEDLPVIQKEMRTIINKGQTFEAKKMPLTESLKYWKKQKQDFKVEILEDLKNEGEKEVTHYSNRDADGNVTFTDLCKGGHVDDLKKIPADGFKLMSIAGAYWRGDESRQQLTRIYVAAFSSKQDLADHLKMLEEAKKRDHRKLGKELDLFTFSEEVGPGLPLWTPKGTVIADALEDFAKEMEEKGGYLRVRTPHIAKGKLYEKTGHLSHYKESMFPPMKVDGEEEYYLKPMNCPHHHKIYASSPRSYRDLPLRLAEYGHCYRYEDSGALFGLMRVRSLSMNDAHIYCTEEQFVEEFLAVTKLYIHYFEVFGVEKYEMHLSLHDPKELGKKYVDQPDLWLKTEEMVRDVMKESGCVFTEVPNEAAFYGPKIDVEVWSAIGREFTLATNQIDFDVPAKMGLTYTDTDGSEKTPLCIHRAPLGTHERFIGFLIEHFAGLFPLWLAPVQLAILPVASVHEKYADQVAEMCKERGLRFQVLDPSESLGKRIREGEKQRIPYLLVLGDKEIADKSVAVRNVKTKEQVSLSLDEFLEKTVEDVACRKLGYSIG